MEHWYTLHTKPKGEYQVTAALQERGIETYLPEIELPRTQAQTRRVKQPFFPCYLFGRIDFETIGLVQVRWTPGLLRVVAFGEQPVPLADEVINLMRLKLDESAGYGGWSLPAFQPGDTVRITNGPLRNMLAIFDGPTTPSQRVQVLLDILGQARRVKLNPADLEKASVEAQAQVYKRPRRTRGQGRYI